MAIDPSHTLRRPEGIVEQPEKAVAKKEQSGDRLRGKYPRLLDMKQVAGPGVMVNKLENKGSGNQGSKPDRVAFID